MTCLLLHLHQSKNDLYKASPQKSDSKSNFNVESISTVEKDVQSFAAFCPKLSIMTSTIVDLSKFISKFPDWLKF